MPFLSLRTKRRNPVNYVAAKPRALAPSPQSVTDGLTAHITMKKHRRFGGVFI